jgi:MFS family permease
MLGMGFVYNWSGLMAARWFLGLAEAGLFPGVNYYLSCWYKRSEFGIRAVSFRHARLSLRPFLMISFPWYETREQGD